MCTIWYACQVREHTTKAPRRRGRPRAADAAAHRRAVVDAAFAELVERGYGSVTMLGVARRAGASKETLYSWFGSKQGLFAALVRTQAEQTARGVAAALDGDDEPRTVLVGFAEHLLAMLLGERSLAINRAAMASAELAAVLLAEGRHTVGPLVERYLDRLHRSGVIVAADPAAAFQTLYGLVVRDTQVRCLLGEPAPGAGELRRQAADAVGAFLRLYGHR